MRDPDVTQVILLVVPAQVYKNHRLYGTARCTVHCIFFFAQLFAIQSRFSRLVIIHHFLVTPHTPTCQGVNNYCKSVRIHSVYR